MKDTKANQRKFPLELHSWLAGLPSNTDFQEIADTYGMNKGALLNLRVRIKAKQKQSLSVGKGE